MNAELRKRVEAFVEEGDYRAAAALCERLGDLRRAKQLYEDLFDHQEAARVALLLNELVEAIRLFLKANDLERAEAVRRTVLAELSEFLPDAIAVFEAHGYHLQAAELATSLGQLEHAARLYKEANEHGSAARLLEKVGQLRAAGQSYERHLANSPHDGDAHLGLGRILQRYGHYKRSLEALDRAISLQEDALEPGQRMAYGFYKLGLDEAAREVLRRVDGPSDVPAHVFVRPYDNEVNADAEAQGAVALDGRYRVERELRPGLFVARDLLRETNVRLHFVAGEDGARERYYETLHRIARPPLRGALRILEINEESHYVATQWVERTLDAWVQSAKPPSARQVVAVVRALHKTLQEAHRRGILHGSVAPQNVALESGNVCALDGFGQHFLESSAATRTEGSNQVLAYRAPEINAGQPGDVRSDLYGLAAVLFFGLSGRTPGWSGSSSLGDEWPSDFSAFFEQALALRPDERFADHAAFERALGRLPWSEVAERTPQGSTSLGEDTEKGGPRYTRHAASANLVFDHVLEREVGFVPDLDPESPLTIDRMHVLTAPELTSFQAILAYSVDPAGLMLEPLAAPTLTETLEALGPLEVHTALECADYLLLALERAHEQFMGLGVIDPDTLHYDGRYFKVPVTQALTLSAEQSQNTIAQDTNGFWCVVYAALTGRKPRLPGPEPLLKVLRSQHALSGMDRETLKRQLPQNGSMVHARVWFEDLRRAVENYRERHAMYAQLEELALADDEITKEERAFLMAQKIALGLDPM